MSPLLQSQRDKLNILRISQEASVDKSDTIKFQFSLHGDKIFIYKTTFEKLGFPQSLDTLYESSYEEPRFILPVEVGETFDILINETAIRNENLWLELESLNNHLAVVPWEQLLLQSVESFRAHPSNINVVRLPALSLKPASFGETVNIVLCHGGSSAEDNTSGWRSTLRFIEHIFDEQPLPKRTLIHVFTDERRAEILMDASHRWRSLEGQSGVIIYDPKAASDYKLPERARTVLEAHGQHDNPWFNWMAGALAEVMVDVVHFFCDGFTSLRHGELAFVASPLREEARDAMLFGNAQQIDTFLTRVGAYSVAFSSPQNSYSITGLRLLAAELSRLRTGPVLFHESGADRHFDDLCDAYKFLYTKTFQELKLSPSLTLYCPPALIDAKSDEMPQGASAALQEFWQARDSLQELVSDKEQLAWAVASYRFLEKLAAIFSEAESETETEQASEIPKGVADGINFVADLVQRHARLQRSDEKATESSDAEFVQRRSYDERTTESSDAEFVNAEFVESRSYDERATVNSNFDEEEAESSSEQRRYEAEEES